MPQNKIIVGFGMVVVLGSAWGVSEAGLGLALNACAKLASGSLMTGVALFFLACSRLRARSARGPLLAVSLALGFKLFDAALLGLPLRSGSMANPMFALAIEAAAAILFFTLLGRTAESGFRGRALLGAGAAGLSALVFPLVGLATGVPACLLPGSAIPLSIAFAPLAMAAGALAVPLAFAFMKRAENWTWDGRSGLRVAVPAAAALLGLAAVALIRLA